MTLRYVRIIMTKIITNLATTLLMLKTIQLFHNNQLGYYDIRGWKPREVAGGINYLIKFLLRGKS